MAGQPAVPLGLTDRVADAFRRQVVCLPEASQTVLLVAAADGTSGLGGILLAAALPGATAADLGAAEHARLLEVSGQSVTFRHPLVQAGVYRAFTYQRRQQAHAALAEALTGSEHADRRAWHLAAAATGPDERVAAELEQAAQRAGSRSGYAAMTAAYQRAAELTSDLTVRSRPWAAAILQRCRALAGPAAKAEDHYAEALRLHARSGRPFERARTQFLYGEWLRRESRRADARGQLAAAAAVFERLGAVPWAQRAHGELRAAGQRSLPQPTETDPVSQLTPQELHIVRLAAAGASNRDIAAQLFLSPRTVGYHLCKAYPRLGVSSRTELNRLPLTAG